MDSLAVYPLSATRLTRTKSEVTEMIGISFGKWNSSHGSMFSWYRVYWNYKWTPIVWARPRYNSEIGI